MYCLMPVWIVYFLKMKRLEKIKEKKINEMKQVSDRIIFISELIYLHQTRESFKSELYLFGILSQHFSNCNQKNKENCCNGLFKGL